MGLITLYQMMFLATVTIVVLAAHRESKKSRASATTAVAQPTSSHQPSAAYFQQVAKPKPIDPAVQEHLRLLEDLRRDGLVTSEEHRTIKNRILGQS